MINGIIYNNKLIYTTNLEVIDNKEFVLIIDGFVKNDYYYTILDSYKKNPLDFIDDIKDFISIFLYDKKQNKMIIINDRIGAKKIYYSIYKDKIIFSNDLSSLKVNKSINLEALSLYFKYDYIPEPLTIFNNIKKLEHGHYLIINKLKIENNCYWDLINIFNNRKITKNYKYHENELNTRLINKIKELSDGKNNIGVYLSSGIDSSLVSAIYSSISKNRINTFSVGFEVNKFNETQTSKKIAEYLNTNHHELIIKSHDAKEYVKKVLDYYPEPFGDASAVCTIVLNEFAKNNNIKFALTGDGSDQIFCGSNIYKTLKRKSVLNPFHIKLNQKVLNNKALYYLFANIPNSEQTQIDIFYREKGLDGLLKNNSNKKIDYENTIKTKNISEKRMILDLNTFMAQKVFPKMCQAGYKNNITILSPYLTKEIIEYSFSIPYKYKYHNKTRKYILKQILFKKIPKDYFKSKKMGFSIPKIEWLKTTLNKDLKRVSSKKYIEKQNIFNYEKVEYLINHIDENMNVVWCYYIFQLWYENNIN